MFTQRGSDTLEDPGVGGRIDDSAPTGFIWLRIGASVGLL